VNGRRVNGVCKPTVKRGKRCTLTVKKLTLTVAGVPGANTHALTLRGLAPGRYTASVTARDVGGRQSKTATIAFTIVKPAH
jgi:hypothetical protein